MKQTNINTRISTCLPHEPVLLLCGQLVGSSAVTRVSRLGHLRYKDDAQGQRLAWLRVLECDCEAEESKPWRSG